MESKIIEKVQNHLELAYDAPNDGRWFDFLRLLRVHFQ